MKVKLAGIVFFFFVRIGATLFFLLENPVHVRFLLCLGAVIFILVLYYETIKCVGIGENAAK